jgi:predicted dehydrogenase
MVDKKTASDRVVLALIGAGGRGTNVILSMKKNTPDVEVKYVCEVDDSRGGRAIDELSKMQGYKPQRVADMRQVFDDNDVHAVVICTPEHWHALATILACQAGKDVYVEKNISLSIQEGRKMVEAATKYKRIVQCGTQNRSAKYARSAHEYIQSGMLGTVVHVKNFCMLPGSKPWFLKPDSDVPEGLDWDQWLGPAEKVPYNVSRHKAWYDWWAYSGGQALSGDASHVMDLARMVLGDPDHPGSVYCSGGRYLYDDKRDVPDIQNITYDFGDFPMSCVSSQFGNYLTKTKSEIRYGNAFPEWKRNATRIEIYGTEGMMYLGRHGGGWQVFRDNGELVAEEYGMFPDIEHQQNFIKAIRTRKAPNGNIEQGHKSASLVHLANISYRLGNKHLLFDGANEAFINSPEANDLDNINHRTGFEIT